MYLSGWIREHMFCWGKGLCITSQTKLRKDPISGGAAVHRSSCLRAGAVGHATQPQPCQAVRHIAALATRKPLHALGCRWVGQAWQGQERLTNFITHALIALIDSLTMLQYPLVPSPRMPIRK